MRFLLWIKRIDVWHNSWKRKFTRICWGSIGNQIPLITENQQRHFIFSLGKTKYILPVMARSVQFK